MTMLNMLGDPHDSAACTMQSTDSFIFTGSNNSIIYSGYGKLKHDSLKMVYEVRWDTSSYTCKYLGGHFN